MDKIAIISDIHGNITALEAVLKDIKNREINRIFCLGDCVTKCTHPDLVIDKIREICDVILIGNCDYVVCKPSSKGKVFGQEIKSVKKGQNLCHHFQYHMNFIWVDI